MLMVVSRLVKTKVPSAEERMFLLGTRYSLLGTALLTLLKLSVLQHSTMNPSSSHVRKL
jgi:hypothetical protein